MEKKTYRIETAKESKGKLYHHEVGKFIVIEDERGETLYLDFYMFPETKFRVRPDNQS